MEITANAPQTVQANQNVLFTDTTIAGNCSIVHREGSGLVTLRGLTEQCRARFRVSFGANITLPTGATITTFVPIYLAITINGEAVNPTTVTVPIYNVNAYNNVYTSTFIDVPANCCSQISVKNTTQQAILVENANLIIERVA